MAKLKVSVIGTGGISKNHMEAYTKNPDVELYALCDLNRERVEEKAKRFGVPLERTYTDKDEMLKAHPDLDMVSVCTWNSAHAECTIAALKAGVNVLCEKPMAMNAEEAEEMLKVAKESGKLLMIGFVRRHGNDCKLVKEYIDNDYFGDIYYAKTTYIRRNGNPGGWFGDKSRSGGGPLIDLGVHVIDFVRYLKGNPKAVSAYGATFQKLFNRPDIRDDQKDYNAQGVEENDICDVEDLATALIRFEDGSVLSVEASFSLNGKPKGEIELFGTKAGAKIDPEVHIFSELNGHLVDIDFDMKTALSFGGLFENEINHYIDCVKNGTKCIAPAEDGVALMKILDAVYESARTGHEVTIK